MSTSNFLLKTTHFSKSFSRQFFFGKIANPKFRYYETTTNGSDPQKPTVLILGWAGANPKHVEKYVQIYTNEGYNVTGFFANDYSYHVPNSKNGSMLDPFFQKHQNSDIVIHSFSMNGVRGYISFWKWILEKPERFKIYQQLSPLKTILPFIRPYVSNFHYIDEKVTLPKKQLYLFSEADDMLRAKDIEEFAERQKSQGNCVEWHDFKTADHVALLRLDGKRYRRICLDFLKKF